MMTVTTVHDAPESICAEARSRAALLSLPYEERMANLEQMAGDSFLIYGKRGPALWKEGHVHAFHTGTAALRIGQLAKGGGDRLCRLLPGTGCSVLDATFGEGKDSLVLSWYTGPEGHVTALEKSPALWEIGRWGIRHFDAGEESVTAALRRIRLIRADFREFLRQETPGYFDVIYFDTMFRRPVKRDENNREAFRSGACYDLIDEDVIKSALRVAKQRVIVKERPFSVLFRSGLFDEIHHKRGQTTAYGVINKR